MQYRTALVTGGSGFLGSHLVDALIKNGVSVVVVDKVDPPPERRNASAEYVRMNIQDEGVRDVFARVKPDVLFHLAAHIDDRESLQKPVENAEDNIIGSLNVFESARLVNVKKIVFASTGVLYGNSDSLPVSEDVSPKPLTPYGVSKLTGERYLNFYWLLYKLPYVALRIGNLYGPRQDASKECGVIAIFTKLLLEGASVSVNNDGTTTRDYVYVQDVVDAMLKSAVGEAVGVFNIGTGLQTSTNDILLQLSKALSMTPTVLPRAEVGDMVKHIALDVTKARNELDWQAKTSLAEGVAVTIDWYRDHSTK